VSATTHDKTRKFPDILFPGWFAPGKPESRKAGMPNIPKVSPGHPNCEKKFAKLWPVATQSPEILIDFIIIGMFGLSPVVGTLEVTCAHVTCHMFTCACTCACICTCTCAQVRVKVTYVCDMYACTCTCTCM